MTEQDLITAAKGGDEAAFGRLVQPYRAELLAHGYRMLGSVHDAEDALQDAMLRAWRGLDGFEGRSSLRSWLHTITSTDFGSTPSRRMFSLTPSVLPPVSNRTRCSFSPLVTVTSSESPCSAISGSGVSPSAIIAVGSRGPDPSVTRRAGP